MEIELRRGSEALARRGTDSDDVHDQAALVSVEHAIVLLSLVLEREPLSLAYRALRSGDDALRGTALEYFENVLPETLRPLALPLFSRLSPQRGSGRDTATLRAKLLETQG